MSMPGFSKTAATYVVSAGVQRSEKPRRVNGVLKKVWILAGDSSTPELKSWQTVAKPAVAAGSSSSTDAASAAQ